MGHAVMPTCSPTSVVRWTVAVLVAACGGVSLPYLDDAGVYHASDGAAVYIPGSACDGWDASHLSDPPPACCLSSGCGGASVVDASCDDWLAARTPPGSPISETGCYQTDIAKPGSCEATWTFASPNTTYPSCPGEGPQGDELCTAWASTFFVHGEKPVFRCQYANDSDGYICWPGTGNLDNYPCGAEAPPIGGPVSSGVYVVFADGGTGCELPCTP